jgi:hypothetical protein
VAEQADSLHSLGAAAGGVFVLVCVCARPARARSSRGSLAAAAAGEIKKSV